jgi:hypothetical protein
MDGKEVDKSHVRSSYLELRSACIPLSLLVCLASSSDRTLLLYSIIEDRVMLKKTIAASLLLSMIAVTAFASQADAKRRCPPGYEDFFNICVYTGH